MRDNSKTSNRIVKDYLDEGTEAIMLYVNGVCSSDQEELIS